jgi:hypothetical protein
MCIYLHFGRVSPAPVFLCVNRPNPLFYGLLMMAERVGFEPTEAYASSVFKTDAIDHSATSPGCCGRGVIYGGDVGLPSGSLIGVGA